VKLLYMTPEHVVEPQTPTPRAAAAKACGEAVVRDAGARGGAAKAIEVRVEVALEGGVVLVLGRRAHGRRLAAFIVAVDTTRKWKRAASMVMT
jgi:hypothetical protein